jgi:hypothetical protein
MCMRVYPACVCVPMCLNMYISVCVCVCVCVICIYTYKIHTCIHAYACVIYVRECISTQTHLCACMYTYTKDCICPVCVYTNITCSYTQYLFWYMWPRHLGCKSPWKQFECKHVCLRVYTPASHTCVYSVHMCICTCVYLWHVDCRPDAHEKAQKRKQACLPALESVM